MRRQLDHPETEAISWQVVWSLWPYLLAFKQRVLWASVCLILAKVASICLPFLLKYVVDALDSDTASGVAGTPNTWLLMPMALVVAYGLARFLNVMFNELRDTLFGRVTEGTMRSVGLATFQHLHRLELDFHLDRRTGAVSRDMERGISAINSLMRFMVFNIIPTLVEVVIVVVLLWVNYGWAFALTIFLSVSAYIFFSVVATEWRTRFVRKANLADSKSNARAIDSLLNYETVKYFTNEDYEARRYDRALEEWQNAKRQNRLSLFALNGGQAFIVALGTTTMLAIAALGVQNGSLTIGDFVLLNAFMMQIFIPLNFLGFVYREIKGSLASIEGLFGLLNQPVKIADHAEASELEITHGEIVYENVSFSYQPEREILHDINLQVKAGETVALVGASGSGKSTLIKLLFRFYEPARGRILIDGQDITTVTQRSLRSALGIVPQDTVLFNDSLGENIRYGRPDASDAEVLEAARLANLGELLAHLPAGLDTQVGERGLKLSGGEKQRVAIARTILKQPHILIFDEATSSLDSRSEQAILSALRDMSMGRTTLVIAHRLSTVVDADRIIVLQQGRVVEQGRHQDLLAHNGVYKSLWQAQQHEQNAEL